MPLNNLSIKDSRGKESITLSFVAVSWFALIIKFVVAGVSLGSLGVMPAMGASEFGMAAAAILAIWLGREWTEKTGNSKGANNA